VKNSKMIKGIAAGAAGLTLLLGGGTFALWYQTQSVASGSVTSGALSFVASTATWKVAPLTSAGAVGTQQSISDITTFKMVPGDTVTLTVPLQVTASGNTIRAALSADVSSITNTTTPAGTDLVTAIKASPLSTIQVDSGSAAPMTSGTASATITGPGTSGHTATITLHFPAYKDGTDAPTADRTKWWGSIAQNQGIDLSSIKIDLAQTL
jgi:alternate signal-mediated exported protein